VDAGEEVKGLGMGFVVEVGGGGVGRWDKVMVLVVDEGEGGA